MTTDLEHHIQATPLVDTHEHTVTEHEYLQNGPDVIQDLFGMYLGNDLISAGVTREDGLRALDAKNPDLEGRWKIIEKFWPYCQHTDYGRGIRLAAQIMYGMDEITLETIQAAARNAQLRQPGERLRMLKETANLDHVQIDDFVWECAPDASGPDFFLYDLSWVGFVCGKIDAPALYEQTQVEVVDVATLRQAMAGLFDRYGDCAIAMKAQQAYERPLTWQARSDADAEYVLQRVLRSEPLSDAEKLCLGDWCWERGVELSVEHHLPFKIHTGFLAGNEPTYVPDHTRPSHFAGLIARHPEAHFVLMHAAYPYGGELLALAKHYRGVYLDLCWAWNMNLLYTIDFVRQAIHSVPTNKLFAFGGDAFSPVNSVGHAAQARDGLTRTLKAEIADGFLSEAEAITIASRFMRENQYAVFDIEGTRAAIQARRAIKQAD